MTRLFADTFRLRKLSSPLHFAFSVAARYLLPRKNHFSQSIISLVSVAVITLVVWLTLLFLSITEGLERNWIDKLTSLSGPVRLTPTKAYFDSYYFQIDGWALASSYTPKSLKEKLESTQLDPYDPLDGPLPTQFPARANKDIVKETAAIIAQLGGRVDPVETASAEVHIRIQRDGAENYLSQTAYLTSTPSDSSFQKILLDPLVLPAETKPLVLAKVWKESGVRVGDEATIVFMAPGFSGVQEMRQPATVAGFFDPGVAPMGGKLMTTDPAFVAQIRAATHMEQWPESTALQVHIDNPLDAPALKQKIATALEKAGLSSYWTVQSYEEYDFAKDLVAQLKSDRMLFTLVALLIMLVACSNIVSMLILLVNDKTKEIGILRAMGASSTSIAIIFGTCGLSLGLMASALGTAAAYFTLSHLDGLVALLSWLQGQQAFNALFFGDQLPSAMSGNALAIIWTATALLSLIAGLIPALRASRIHPAQVLRS